MRVFVLAIDGLEYELVERWKLTHLMQRYHGIFKIKPEYFTEGYLPHSRAKIHSPYTPIIWTSFLTGRKPEEHGIKELRTYIKLPEFLRYSKSAHYVKNSLNKVLGFYLGKLLKISPPFLVDRRDIPYPTIFDIVRESVAVWFICYNEPSWIFNMISNALKYDTKSVPRILWYIYKLRLREVLKRLCSPWKLFGVYFEIADTLGHLYMGKSTLKLLRVYLELNSMVKKLKRIALNNDVAFLIVSDHGMKASSDGLWGVHSEYAFWSSNIELPKEPKDHADFFYIITKLLSHN